VRVKVPGRSGFFKMSGYKRVSAMAISIYTVIYAEPVLSAFPFLYVVTSVISIFLLSSGCVLLSRSKVAISPFIYTASHYGTSASRRKYFAYIILIDGRFKNNSQHIQKKHYLKIH
jgi:hypothetical protein